MSADLAALRSYVTAEDDRHFSKLRDGMVMVQVTHSNLKQHNVLDLRIDLGQSVGELKRKLQTFNGTNPSMMDVVVFNGDAVICKLVDDARPVGFYGVENGMRLHVIDNDKFSLSRHGGLEDVSKVKKYEISDEAYEGRKDNFRKWKQDQLAKDPTWKFLPQGPQQAADKPDCTAPECIEGIEVGMRCAVSPGERRGEVAFVGQVPGLAAGFWIGVRFDEPVGKGDGTRNGTRYFDCEPKYGAFVRPHNLAVGDYPPAGLSDLEDSDDEL